MAGVEDATGVDDGLAFDLLTNHCLLVSQGAVDFDITVTLFDDQAGDIVETCRDLF